MKRLLYILITVLAVNSTLAQVEYTAGGSGGAYTLNYPSNISSITNGLSFTFKANHANTGPASLSVNGFAAISIKKAVYTDLDPGDIQLDQVVTVVFDGTNFQMTTLPGNIGGGSALWSNSGSDTYLTNTTDEVGIGTSTPAAKLNVAIEAGYFSNAILATNINNTNGTSIIEIQNNGSGPGINSSNTGNGPAGTFTLSNGSSSTNAVTIQTNGASSKGLEITHSGSASSSTDYGVYSVSNGAGASSTNVGGYFNAINATYNYAAIFDNGDVGIGITMPTAKLDLNGDFNMIGLSAAPGPANAGEGKIYFDSGSGMFMVSENGSAWTPLLSAGGGDFYSDGSVPMVGNLDLNFQYINNLQDPVNPYDAANMNYVDNAITFQLGDYVNKFGDMMNGNLDMNYYSLTNLVDPTNPYDAATMNYVDNAFAAAGDFHSDGSDVMIGNLDMGYYNIVNLIDPSSPQDAATMNYVDNAILSAGDFFADGSVPMNGNLDMGFYYINNLFDPVASQDAATKNYVDNVFLGAGDFYRDGSAAMTGQFLAIVGTTISPGIAFSGDNSTGLFSPSLSQIAFSSAGVETMRIDASGNVGIGNPSPLAKLDIAGSVTLENDANRLLRGGSGGDMIPVAYGVYDGETQILHANATEGDVSVTYVSPGAYDLNYNGARNFTGVGEFQITLTPYYGSSSEMLITNYMYIGGKSVRIFVTNLSGTNTDGTVSFELRVK